MTRAEAIQAARPGQFIRCDIYGRYLETVDYLTNGLGRVYRKRADGTAERYYF